MTGRLFDIDDVPEVPIFREPPPGRGALVMDERLSHDYPPQWNRCPTCVGTGHRASRDNGTSFACPAMALLPDDPRLEGRVGFSPSSGIWDWVVCVDCKGMGSVKARVRLEAGHRCERCGHPYMPKGDAKMLGVQPTPYHWSPCDDRCTHHGAVRMRELYRGDGSWREFNLDEVGATPSDSIYDEWPDGRRMPRWEVEAEWRILTVHHLDGDKANLRWWNLAALCQRCHLHIQGKVVMDRVYPHEHSEWFKPHAAGWYAFIYLGEDLSREQVAARQDALLALELAFNPKEGR